MHHEKSWRYLTWVMLFSLAYPFLLGSLVVANLFIKIHWHLFSFGETLLGYGINAVPLVNIAAMMAAWRIGAHMRSNGRPLTLAVIAFSCNGLLLLLSMYLSGPLLMARPMCDGQSSFERLGCDAEEPRMR